MLVAASWQVDPLFTYMHVISKGKHNSYFSLGNIYNLKHMDVYSIAFNTNRSLSCFMLGLPQSHKVCSHWEAYETAGLYSCTQNGPNIECGTMNTLHPQQMPLLQRKGHHSVSMQANISIRYLANVVLATAAHFIIFSFWDLQLEKKWQKKKTQLKNVTSCKCKTGTPPLPCRD